MHRKYSCTIQAESKFNILPNLVSTKSENIMNNFDNVCQFYSVIFVKSTSFCLCFTENEENPFFTMIKEITSTEF